MHACTFQAPNKKKRKQKKKKKQRKKNKKNNKKKNKKQKRQSKREQEREEESSKIATRSIEEMGNLKDVWQRPLLAEFVVPPPLRSALSDIMFSSRKKVRDQHGAQPSRDVEGNWRSPCSSWAFVGSPFANRRRRSGRRWSRSASSMPWRCDLRGFDVIS